MKRVFLRLLLPLFLLLAGFYAVGSSLVGAIRDVEPHTSGFSIRKTLDGYRAASPRVVRVAIPYKSRLSGELSPYGPGFELELLDHLRRETGAPLRLVDVPTSSDALRLLEEKTVDLVAGFAIPDSALKTEDLASGPSYHDIQTALILQRPAKTSTQGALLFCDDALAPALEGASRARTFPENAILVPAEQDILEHLKDKKATHGLIDQRSLRVWTPFFPAVPGASLPLGQPAAHRWVWRADDGAVNEMAGHFWQNRKDDTLLEELEERYFGFLPRKMNRLEVNALLKVIETKLRLYAAPIARAARQHDIDPLLLAALIFQESHFNPEACSSTGVRGIMQLTAETASALGVDRLDPVQSIEAGARYLRRMWKSLEPLSLSPWDRWFFTLAGYNQGLGHLHDAIALARSRKAAPSDPLTWRSLRHVYPLLTQERFYNASRHGYCRGHEAVDFVDKVRFYYYVLNGLVVLDRPQARHLSPLLRAMPPVWPEMDPASIPAPKKKQRA